MSKINDHAHLGDQKCAQFQANGVCWSQFTDFILRSWEGCFFRSFKKTKACSYKDNSGLFSHNLICAVLVNGFSTVIAAITTCLIICLMQWKGVVALPLKIVGFQSVLVTL